MDRRYRNYVKFPELSLKRDTRPPIAQIMKVRPRSKPARKPTRGRQTRVAAAPRGRTRVSNPLALPAECTLADAAALKKALCALLPRAGTVTLDAAAVERIDTAALQLLAAFVRDRRLAGRVVQWRTVSNALSSAACLLGMDSMLSLAEAAQ